MMAEMKASLIQQKLIEQIAYFGISAEILIDMYSATR